LSLYLGLVRRRFVLLLLAVYAVGFSLLVPVASIPNSHHTICDQSGCVELDQYGSASYFLFCTGAIYDTSGQYWLSTRMYSVPGG